MSHVVDARTSLFAPGLVDEATLRLLSVPVLIFASLYLISKALPKSAQKQLKGLTVIANGAAAAKGAGEYAQFDFASVRVSKILVHPIKSCKGTSVAEVAYTPQGLENDRKWAIVYEGTNKIVTAREVSKMVLIHPKIKKDASSPDGGVLEVSFPSDSGCESFAVPLSPSEATLQKWRVLDDVALFSDTGMQAYVCESAGPSDRSPSAILSQYVGAPVALAMKGPRPRACAPTRRHPKLDAAFVFQDGYPLMVCSEESVGAVQARVRAMVGEQGVEARWADEELVVERFRPNIVFKGAGAPFVEDAVQQISIHRAPAAEGGAVADGPAPPVIDVVSKCTRCLLPNVSPVTGERDKAVPFKPLSKFRRGLDPERPQKACLGSNAVPTGSGVVRVGDVVQVHRVGDV